MVAFFAAPIDLRIKNLFSSPASLPSGKNGKIECIKAFSTILVSFLPTEKKDCTLKCHFSRDCFESADACAGWLEEKSFSKTKFPFEILNLLRKRMQCCYITLIDIPFFIGVTPSKRTFIRSFLYPGSNELREYCNLFFGVVNMKALAKLQSCAVSAAERSLERTITQLWSCPKAFIEREMKPLKTHLEKCIQPKPKPKRLLERPTLKGLKTKEVKSITHLKALIVKALLSSGNIETNPGPAHQLTSPPAQLPIATTQAVTYNVRGLKDETKLRHLINYLHKEDPGKNVDFIVCLQETYLEKDGRLPFLWRGNYHLTPGNGNSCGCITMLSPHLNIVASQDIENRAHILACQKSGSTDISYLIVNLYAPNPNNSEKVDFFEKIFDTLHEFELRYNCRKSIVLGDFNLTLDKKESKNRLFTAQEQRVAAVVKKLCEEGGFSDLWEDTTEATWNRANSNIFSTIDRIMFNKDKLEEIQKKTNWALSCSDHAAVEVKFRAKSELVRRRTRLTRLDPSLAKIPECRTSIEEGYNELISQIPLDWDPHQKLEFAKVCIRTVVEKVQADRKKFDQSEEERVNEELTMSVEALEKGNLRPEGVGSLIDHIEDLRGQKRELVHRMGTRMAEKLKTKWFNEGEKSNRYFLRLLNRQMPDDFKKITREDGRETTDQDEIENEVVAFYRKLYEDPDENEIEEDDDFLRGINPISGQEAAEVVTPITQEELRNTLHTCEDSSPGPDGIPYSIIGLLWTSFGKLLADAWNHSLRIGKLTSSHRMSYLKLIPKEGKDLSKLTNWRPITLSNCDHKLITKTYSKRLSTKVAAAIGEAQTAYLKGRLINDNIRAMAAAVNLGNLEENVEGLIVALDAKKAFDSVSHDYIARCLKKFGCEDFIPIFKILYADLKTDIIVNGRVVKGYLIKRGVKQGDALSCILFIMCMEPLIKNIEENPQILPLVSTAHGQLPKTYAYADDVSAVISDDIGSLQALFVEYEALTKNSGLQLNADKTELMKIGSNPVESSYNVNYRLGTHNVRSKPVVKINGILFQRDRSRMTEANVKLAMDRMDSHFRKWARRGLTTLGKILIVKTFGISQLVYLLQTLTLNETHYKQINAVLYKFIWNRNYLLSKAPERIKRDIMIKSLRLGGYGMIDIRQLDASLKLRALGRLLVTKHPFLSLIKNDVDLNQFFEPRCKTILDEVAVKGIELLKADRQKLWLCEELDTDRAFMATVRQIKIKSIVCTRGQQSIPYFVAVMRGVSLIGDLNLNELNSLVPFIDRSKLAKIRLAVILRLRQDSLKDQIYASRTFKSITTCTSKEIRLSRIEHTPLTSLKIGLDLERSEALTWFYRLSKLSSISHRNTLLRVMHGEIYTKERKFRFGLSDSPVCPRCEQIETAEHKLIECIYVRKIWRQVQLKLKVTPGTDTIRETLAVQKGLTVLSVHAEILQRILHLREDQNFLMHPKTFVELALQDLLKKEGNGTIKNEIVALL